MMPYALLQLSLDQTIRREDLEEASVVAPSVARADCALLQRELFGIVVRNLEHGEALALQAALRARNFPTEVVEQSTLLVLPPPKRGQALKLTEVGAVVADFYGNEQLYAKEQFVFAAAGHVLRLANRPFQKLESVQRYVGQGHFRQTFEMVTDHRLKDVLEFRVELFFSQEPYRLQWILDGDGVLRANAEIFKLRDRQRLSDLLAALGHCLPADRVNLGIRRATAGEELVYPSVRAFEEEIVWSFCRLMRA
jgi:hypothetical protein